MSRREQIRMSDAEVEEFLQGRHVMNIASFGPDGNIHLVAMWYGFLGANTAFATFAKSQKVLNLQRDSRITVLVEAGEEYEELQGVEIVGRAIIHDDDTVKRAVATTVAERYFGITDPAGLELAVAPLVNKRVSIEIVPERVVSWDHRKLAGVY